MTATTEGAEEPLTGRKIAIDSLGNAYLTGTTSSTDFPTSTGAFQRTFQGWIRRLRYPVERDRLAAALLDTAWRHRS
jgi:hypothetical protein